MVSRLRQRYHNERTRVSLHSVKDGTNIEKMWLEKLKECKIASKMSSKDIADKANLPERTVKRIFSGETANPYLDTLHRIATALDVTLDEILTDTKAVVADQTLVELKETVVSVEEELESNAAENAELKEQVANMICEIKSLKTTIEMLELKLAHKDEIIALHNYYNKLQNK